MLASLRPRSPSVFVVDPHRSQTHKLSYSGLPFHRSSVSEPSPMEGSGGKRHNAPPVRLGPPQQLASTSYAPDAEMDIVEQRPSPQLRQRSWHHPYMSSARGARALSPSAAHEHVAGPSTRSYDFGPQDGIAPRPQHRSPRQRDDRLRPAPEPRSRIATRDDGLGRAQPVNISALPAHPLLDVERVGGIGPNRNRGRSSTLTLPHQEASRARGHSFIRARHDQPPHGALYGSYDEPVPFPPRSWEEGRSYPNAYAQHGSAPPMPSRRSPNLRPSSRHSPILFAPLSPGQDPQAHYPQRGSGHMPTKLGHAGVIAAGGDQYRSRPGTPISPLNMENLSMEEAFVPSASGMAVPLAQGQQRSPADVRRSDYFGPGMTERGRPKLVPQDLSGSPPHGAHISETPQRTREHAYRTPLRGYAEGVSPEVDMPRHPQSSYFAAQPHVHSGRGPTAAAPAHHPATSRMDQTERERFAMSQQHAPSTAGYHGAGGPQEHGYKSEFVSQSRFGPGSGFAGHLSQHAVPVDRIAHSRRRRRPPYSYSSMITQAIASSNEGRMTLREIYTWISNNFSGYPMLGPDSQGWQNTVRHNLSLGKIFIKKARTAQDIYDSCSSGNPSQSQAARGKGGWWTLHPVVLSQIRSGQRTHSDEFDDVERLVEIENAAARGSTSATTSSSGAVAVDSAPSNAPMDDLTAPRGPFADSGQAKSLSRQRSYSDTRDATSAEQSRSSSSQHSSTTRMSRQGSMWANRDLFGGHNPYAPHAAQLATHKISRGPTDHEEMPSVLQPSSEHGPDDKSAAYGRLRGHTIAVHERPSQQRTSQHEGDRLGAEAYVTTRPPSGSLSSPRPLYQSRTQAFEDVEMEPSSAQPRDSSQVLQQARDTLETTKHQQQMLQRHRDVDEDADAPEGAGRMAIRGLLNS